MWFQLPTKIITAGAEFKERQNLNVWLVSDIHSAEGFTMPRLKSNEYDLVFTMGDMSESVLDYVKWMSSPIPVFGIYGNHDPKIIPGFQALDNVVLNIKGWRISGVSGSRASYRMGHENKKLVHVCSERQIESKLRKIGPLDILITHALPFSVSTQEDPVHQGFKVLDKYIEAHCPKYVIHGHLHRRYRISVGQTMVVGVYENDYLKITGS